jgi:hypothetical protein
MCIVYVWEGWGRFAIQVPKTFFSFFSSLDIIRQYGLLPQYFTQHNGIGKKLLLKICIMYITPEHTLILAVLQKRAVYYHFLKIFRLNCLGLKEACYEIFSGHF